MQGPSAASVPRVDGRSGDRDAPTRAPAKLGLDDAEQRPKLVGAGLADQLVEHGLDGRDDRACRPQPRKRAVMRRRVSRAAAVTDDVDVESRLAARRAPSGPHRCGSPSRRSRAASAGVGQRSTKSGSPKQSKATLFDPGTAGAGAAIDSTMTRSCGLDVAQTASGTAASRRSGSLRAPQSPAACPRPRGLRRGAASPPQAAPGCR